MSVQRADRFSQLILTPDHMAMFPIDYKPYIDLLTNHIAKSLDLSRSAKKVIHRDIERAFTAPRIPILHAGKTYLLAEPGFDIRYHNALNRLKTVYFLHAHEHDGYLIFTDGFGRSMKFSRHPSWRDGEWDTRFARSHAPLHTTPKR